MKIVVALVTLLSRIYLGNGQRAVTFLEPTCGVSLSTIHFKVMGGQTANMFANPWMALILSDIICGGSLITDRFVLTAGHCISHQPAVVHLGDFNRSTTAQYCSRTACMPRAIKIPVVAQISHPRFVNPAYNDIALFRLAWRVQFTDFIRPICLLTNYDPLPQMRFFTVSGWGETEHGTGSDVLKTTNLEQVDRSKCLIYGRRIDLSHICAGDRASGVCRGDSGGPVHGTFMINGRTRVVQVGLVSYGDHDCRSWSVLTNVMYHMNWIAYTVGKVQ
ncbi:melanization protease 1-like [Drosophila subpulchrella]|uniref:melanization protease 1-like n=1 Tax=Drosophila subpulchrella TaxID=1486046 RepID=UPI0018A158DA|nr:melanization protease 1-like [Drosophila subpulchrella]